MKDVIVARNQRLGTISAALTTVLIVVLLISVSTSLAQSGKAKAKPVKPLSAGEAKQIDARLQKLQDTFEIESKAIIEGYERSGQYDRAKFLVEVLLKLDPKNEEFKKKIEDLNEQSLKTSEFDLKFDANSDWTPVGNVIKDRLTRIQANGDYKLMLPAASVSADGFPTKDIMTDLVGGVPTGALMGMVVTDENHDNKPDRKIPDVFAVRSKHEFTPKKDGVLYLKINSPPGSKCIGDLKLKLSGVGRAS
jgi:hypothetical protein